MKLSPIPRIPYLSKEEFAAYLAQPSTPLVLTDVMDDWPAMHSWSFDFFAKEFANFPVTAHAPQFPALAKWSIKTCVKSYVAYLQDPSAADISGTWLQGDAESLRNNPLTLYAGDFNPAHPIHGKPSVIFEYVPDMPEFIESWLDLLENSFRERCQLLQSHHFVYLSIAGGITPLHHDFWDTHAFLAQISGTKQAVLFSPSFMDTLYQEQTGDVRRMIDDPRFDDVEGWSATLHPGEMLIIPSRWLHYVETLEPSITYSADWIDGSNWRAYAALATKALHDREGRP